MWKFYHDKRQQAQSGCRLELETEGQEGNSCAQLDNLERLVYEVAFSGDAEQLYHVLRVSLHRHGLGMQRCVLAAPSSLV